MWVAVNDTSGKIQLCIFGGDRTIMLELTSNFNLLQVSRSNNDLPGNVPVKSNVCGRGRHNISNCIEL